MLANQRLLQTLLVDRFKLILHPDTRDLEFHTLVVAENGPKLQQSKAGDPVLMKSKVRTAKPIGQRDCSAWEKVS